MKAKSLLMLCIVILLFGFIKVEALQGDASSGVSAEASGCGAGWCVSTGNYGVRISITDSNGGVKGKAISVMVKLANITINQLEVKNRFPNAKSYDVIEYKINDKELVDIAPLLEGLEIIDDGKNNYDKTVNTKIQALKGDDKAFKSIIELTGADVTPNDYLVVEPLTVIYEHGTTTYYYGTAYELVEKITGDYYGSRILILERLGKAMISLTHNLTIPNVATDQGASLVPFVSGIKNTIDHLNKNMNLWSQYTYGVAIYSLEKMVNQCKIGVNNNKDNKYNWIKYDDATQQYLPINEGCCYSHDTYGISADDVLSNYPQCFSEDEIGDKCSGLTTSNKNCNSDEHYSSINNKPKKNLNACLASRKYYTGVIDAKNRIFYGCYYSDKLNFPGAYNGNLMVGSHFVWPTDDTMLKFGLIDLSYGLSRTSTAKCFAYQIDNETGLYKAYNGDIKGDDTKSIIKKIKNKINNKDEKVTLKQNGKNAGDLEYSFLNKTLDKEENGYFSVTISGVYRQIIDSSEGYRYYDNENLKYLKFGTVNKNKLNSYVEYPYMVLPIDRNFNQKEKYQYSLEYLTDFAGLEMNSTYTCESKIKKIPTCVCPAGTDNAGLDLTNYYKSTTYGTCKDVGKTAICSTLIDEYCNNKNLTDFKCPNCDKNLSECVRKKINSSSEMTQIKAYNECVYEECNCTGSNCDYKKLCPNPDSDPDLNSNQNIIFRPIFLDNPFPSIKGSIRMPGSNWGGQLSLNNKNYMGLVKKYIIDTEKYMYQGQAMYSITLKPKVIQEIKKYNKENKYDDFNLECDNGGKCYSKFLHEVLPGYDSNIVSGTCAIINSKSNYYTNFEQCRLDSFNK